METAAENEVEVDGGAAGVGCGDALADSDGAAVCSLVTLAAAEPEPDGTEAAPELTAMSGACVDVGFGLSFSVFVAAASLLPRRV